MSKPYGPKYEKEQKKLRGLQHDLLTRLKESGPRNYDSLYVQLT